MKGKNLEAEAQSKEEMMRMHFGEGIGCLSGDSLDASKEHEIFLGVSNGTTANGASISNIGAATCSNNVGNNNVGPTDNEANNLEHSDIVSNILLSDSLHTQYRVPYRIVESLNQGILSNYYFLIPKGKIDGTGDSNGDLVLQNSCVNQNADDGKEALQVKYVPSPVSQESISSGLVMTGLPPPTEEMNGALTRVNPGSQEFGILDLDAFDVAGKKAFIKGLPNRLHSHAHNLLVDASWKIERRKRHDRVKPAFTFFCPDDGRSYKSLCQAWKACGKKFLADVLSDNQVEIGREWSDIETFWVDLAAALAYIDEAIQHSVCSLSLTDRWLLLDPFMAVVWIDKRISALRERRVVKAVNSTTCVPHRDIGSETKHKNGVEVHLPEPKICSLGSKNHASLPDVVSDGKLDVAEGKGSHDAKHLHGMSCNSFSTISRKRKRTSNESASTHRCYSLSCTEGSISHDLLAQCSTAPALEASTPQSLDYGQITNSSNSISCSTQLGEIPSGSKLFDFETTEESDQLMTDCHSPNGKLCFKSDDDIIKDGFACKNLSVPKAISSAKKTRKRSKKISEIEATVVRRKDLKEKQPHRNCEEASGFIADGKISGHPDFQFNQDKGSVFNQKLASEEFYHKGFLKENTHVQNASITETVHSSALPDVSSTKEVRKKNWELKTLSANRFVKSKHANPPLTQDDESGITLSNMEKVHDDSEQLKSTKSKNNRKSPSYNKSMSVCLSQCKNQSKSDNAQPQCHGSEESVAVADCDMISVGLDAIKGVNDGLASAYGPSPDPGHREKATEKATKAKKSALHKETGRKRPRIHDNDLLISAIIKHSSPKAQSSQSKSKSVKKRKNRKGSCTLLLRTPAKGGKRSTDSRRFILGRRTVLCWLIEMGFLSLKDIVQCQNQKTKDMVKDGLVTVDGILCNCCSKVLSVTKFMAHAGLKLRKLSNLFLQSGESYTLCIHRAWLVEFNARKRGMKVTDVKEVDQNDDTCGICGDGGVLVCCDNCPSTYHQACLREQEIPEGSWYCSKCICLGCGDVVTQKQTTNPSDILQCLQCEHKYHDYCTKEKVIFNMEMTSKMWFCGAKCQEVYMGLRTRVGVLNSIEDGFSWSILRCSPCDQKNHSSQKIALAAECHSKLAIALTIMEECFLPMVDPRTGIDMIPQVLYNLSSKFPRLNYQGFYTAVLEKDDEIMCVASLRVHGTKVAEMPLIATCSEHRRQGMCKRLMNAVEEMMKSLKVEMLVLSAIPSLVETWMSGFGFVPIGDDDQKLLNNINLMLFPGTLFLKKNLYEPTTEKSGWDTDLCAGEAQSSRLGSSDGRTSNAPGLHISENARIGLEVEPMDDRRNRVAFSSENPVYSHGTHAALKVTDAHNLYRGTSDGCVTTQFLRSEDVASQVFPTNDSSLGLSLTDSVSSLVANNGPPVDWSSKADFVTLDTEDNKLPSANLLTKIDRVDVTNKGQNTDYGVFGEVVELKDSISTSEEPQCSIFLQGLAQKGSGLADPYEQKLEEPVGPKVVDAVAGVTCRSRRAIDAAADIIDNVWHTNHNQGYEVEDKVFDRTLEDNIDNCLFHRVAQKSSLSRPSNLNIMKLEELAGLGVSLDDPMRTSKNETFDFVDGSLVLKDCAIGKFEPLNFSSVLADQKRNISLNHLESSTTDLNQVGITLAPRCSSSCQSMLHSSTEKEIGEGRELPAVQNTAQSRDLMGSSCVN